MSDEIKADVTLDLKGLPCPLPVVKVSGAIKNVPVGGVILAIATDPGALADFPAWCKSTGNELLKTERADKELKFYIKRVS